MENKLIDELESIVSEIKVAEKTLSEINTSSESFLDKVKLGRKAQEYGALRYCFLRFYPLVDMHLLSKEVQDLYEDLSEQEKQMNELLSDETLLEKFK